MMARNGRFLGTFELCTIGLLLDNEACTRVVTPVWVEVLKSYLSIERDSVMECLFGMERYPRIVVVILHQIILLLGWHCSLPHSTDNYQYIFGKKLHTHTGIITHTQLKMFLLLVDTWKIVILIGRDGQTDVAICNVKFYSSSWFGHLRYCFGTRPSRDSSETKLMYLLHRKIINQSILIYRLKSKLQKCSFKTKGMRRGFLNFLP